MTHQFVKGDGTRRVHFWVTDVPCHACNQYGADPDRVLGVISDYDNTIVLECLNCGQEVREHSDLFKHEHTPPPGYAAALAKAQAPER